MAEEALSVKDFIPVVGGNYIAPHLVSLTASVYNDFKYPRPVMLIPKTPATAGIVFIYPGAYPANDLASINIPAGNNVYLDARGEWYVKTSSGVAEQFLVIDAGAAGNAAAIAASFGLTPATSTPNRAAFYTAQKDVAAASTPVNCSAQPIPNGFALVIRAKTANVGNISVGNSSANALIATGAGYLLAPGEATRLYVTNANLVWLDATSNGNGVCLGAEV